MVYQPVLTKETDLMQAIQIHKILQDWLAVATHRVRCVRVLKVCLHAGDPKDPFGGLELTVVPHASLYQEAKRSAMEGWRLSAGRLKKTPKVTGAPLQKQK